MRSARRASVVAVLVTLFALATGPSVVLAADSITEQLISRLNRQLLYLAVPIAILVEVILAYTVWRFHDNEEAAPTRENRQLEITWTIATALVLLFVGTASFHVLAHPMMSSTPETVRGDYEPGDTPEAALEVHVVAEQWDYSFEYPRANVTTEEALVLPTNRTVYLYATSEDVIHSVHVPELGLKQDVFPQGYQVIRTELWETGEYRLYCAELCGVGHARMRSTVRVVEESAFESWLEEGGPPPGAENGTSDSSAGGEGAPNGTTTAGTAAAGTAPNGTASGGAA